MLPDELFLYLRPSPQPPLMKPGHDFQTQNGNSQPLDLSAERLVIVLGEIGCR